jgi:hypothetical protein
MTDNKKSEITRSFSYLRFSLKFKQMEFRKLGERMLLCENNHEMEADSKFCASCGARPAFQTFELEAQTHTDNPQRDVKIMMNLEPESQSRLSVIFRFFLVLPLYVLIYFVNIAVQMVTIVSWFSALFTKRIPEGIHKFVAGYLNLQANLAAYTFLLTAKWPGFNLAMSENDQVKVLVPQGDFNRAAVFFRIILGLPAILLNGIFAFGSWLMHLIMWISASFTGHTPRGLHQASASIIRLQTRTSAYFLLLTPEQPWTGIFGDRRAEVIADDSSSTPPWEWTLVKSARRWLAVTLVVGIISYVGYILLIGQVIKAAANQSTEISAIYVCDYTTGSFEVSLESFTCEDGSHAVKELVGP